MLLDRLRSNFLEARDLREEVLSRALSEKKLATVFISLNIPGENKTHLRSEELFLWALAEIKESFSESSLYIKTQDILGFYAIVMINEEPETVKKNCIKLENMQPASRLVDLDVYSKEGTQIDRHILGQAPRVCLICDEPAVNCIRQKKHSMYSLINRANELLQNFISKKNCPSPSLRGKTGAFAHPQAGAC